MPPPEASPGASLIHAAAWASLTLPHTLEQNGRELQLPVPRRPSQREAPAEAGGAECDAGPAPHGTLAGPERIDVHSLTAEDPLESSSHIRSPLSMHVHVRQSLDSDKTEP